MRAAPYLQKNDTIALHAPARKIGGAIVQKTIELLNSWGLEVLVDDRLYEEEHQFAGSDETRAALLEEHLQNPKVKAILCVRGGYGSVRLLEHLSGRYEQAKWVIGYSDVTALHCWVQRRMGWMSIHATMPVNMIASGEDVAQSNELLRQTLFGEPEGVPLPKHPLNRPGDAQGILIGGNLSVLYSLLGSDEQPDTNGAILLLEDLDEYLYHIDRMMMALDRAGMLEQLSALVIGGMNDMNDNETPFGSTAYETIARIAGKYEFPIFFGVEIGHLELNRPVILGASYTIEDATLLLSDLP